MGWFRDLFDFSSGFKAEKKKERSVRNEQVQRVPINNEPEKFTTEPWVSIVGEGIDPDKGLQIQLDWNEPFIKFLKSNGYVGANDESVVGQWLVHLYRHVAEEIEQKKIHPYE